MKQIALAIVTVLVAATAFAQDNERPTKSRFWKNKMSTFSIKPGDILVYEIDNGTGKQQMLVHVKSFGNGANVRYEFPSDKKSTAVALEKSAIATGKGTAATRAKPWA